MAALPDRPGLAGALGGCWRGGAFVVDRRWAPSAVHGRERVGALAERLERSAGEAPLFTGGAPARPPFVFFDLETTGLSGGAGTLAFLVGCGWFEGDGSFVTRQFLLARHADERMFLESVAAELERAGALVSFNGKSFDAPLLEGRYLFHRIAWRGREMPHVDVLHPARRFWKTPVSGARALLVEGTRGGGDASCSLQSLERQLVGLRRRGDVPGIEIPAMYFRFVRSGDAAPLEAVLEHNRLDLLTLAALTARLMDLTRRGPDAAGDAREALALGHVYARADRQAQGALEERARTSFRRAIDRCRSPRGAYDPIRIEALRALALACRRARMHDEAAAAWRELVEMRGCPAPILRAAAEALAIHHEHRLRDLPVAKAFALRNLESGRDLGWADAARYRLARLERKLATENLKFDV
ncbi:MAG TPA: ribonuclease H-like domain-containing protein [Vicinamibacterales bacterium]|nr:ribonuclease H-like domain-containing protein [Vicinamibacterales bacterium]